MEQNGAVRRFNGETTDPREYKRWEKWARSHLRRKAGTLTPEQWGPEIFCILDGLALTLVDHLELDDYSAPGGEELIFHALSARYPDGAARQAGGGA